jgi:dynein heavy chain
MITGPPYAIFSIVPKTGPLTGKTKIVITGDGFKETSIVVRFDAGYKTSPEVSGTFIDEKTIECETPSFENVGLPKEAIVTISLNKGDYSITTAEFCYFYNTKADHCIAIGPGVL